MTKPTNKIARIFSKVANVVSNLSAFFVSFFSFASMIIHEISIWKVGGNGFNPSKMKLLAKAEKGLLQKVSDESEISPQIAGGSRKNFINILQEDGFLIQCKFHGKDSFFKCRFKHFMSNKALFGEGRLINKRIEFFPIHLAI